MAHIYSSIQQLFIYLLTDKSAVVAVEYAMTIAFVAILASVGMAALGDGVAEFFTKISETLFQAGDPLPTLSS